MSFDEREIHVQERLVSSPFFVNKEYATKSTIHLSICFFLIFIAFSSSQNFVTSYEGDEGYILLGVLYSSFSLGNIVSPPVVRSLGLRVSLVLGGLCYVLFVFHAVVDMPPPLLYVIAAINGCGAAILWTAQGVAIVRLGEGIYTSMLSGIFFSIYQLNQAVGNLIVAFLFQMNLPRALIFSVATGICLMGVMGFLGIRFPTLSAKMLDHDSLDQSRIWSAIAVLKEMKMILIIGIIVFNGISESFIFGYFPASIGNVSIKFYAMCVFGVVNAGACLILGWITDRLGKKILMTFGSILSLVCYLMIAFLYHQYHTTGMIFFFAIMLGLVDAVWTTQLFLLLSDFYPQDPESAFAVLKMVQSGSTAIGFMYAPFTSLLLQSTLCLGFLVLGSLSLLYLHTYVTPI